MCGTYRFLASCLALTGYGKDRLAQCQDNVTEWDIGLRHQQPDFPIGYNYKFTINAHCHWYDLRCCKEMKLPRTFQPTSHREHGLADDTASIQSVLLSFCQSVAYDMQITEIIAPIRNHSSNLLMLIFQNKLLSRFEYIKLRHWSPICCYIYSQPGAVRALVSRAGDRGFEPRSSQTNDL